MRFFLILITVIYTATSSLSQNIDIALFHNKTVTEIILSSKSGKYQIIADSSHIITVGKNAVIKISFADSVLIVKDLNSLIGNYKTLE